MSKQKIKYDVVVIGAGVTGLMATYELAKKGKKVLVLEQSNKIGGLLNSYKISNYNIEAFYHHIFPYNKYLLNLLSELDLKNRILWKQTSTVF